MKVTKVCCQGCGADLELDEFIRYVTCNYCNARLEVVHDATVTHTKQLDKIERTTDDLAKKLQVIELQNDIEHLDREWEKFRDAALTRDEKGQICEPSGGGSIIAVIVGIGFGIFWIVMCVSNQVAGVALVGILFIVLSIFGMMRGSDKAAIYHVQKDRYEAARTSLLGRLDGKRRS